MSALTTTCTSCGKGLKIRDELVGRKIKCPGCGNGFTPTANAVATPAPQFTSASAAARTAKPTSGGFDWGFLNARVIVGLILISLGLGATALSYVATSSARGGYFVFYGLIISGAIRVVPGLAAGD